MTRLLNKNVVVVGIGRVGLPLALVLAKEGFKVTGVDISERALELINKGKIPFTEEGGQQLLKKNLNNRFIAIHEIKLPEVLTKASAVILTMGTPIGDNFIPDVTQITGFLNKSSKFLQKGQLLILRSTVTPGTTEYIARFFKTQYNWVVGKDIYLAYCPERIAEGKAIQELYEIPQIIGSLDNESGRIAGKIFGKLTKKLLFSDSRSAELSKLYCNMYRYVDFAIGNEFMLIADDHQRDIYEILRLVNDGYKRNGLKGPGLTAGPCLVKDGFFLLDKSPYLDLVSAAWRLNENIPGFLLRKIHKSAGNLLNKKIALLGLTFKKNIDDLRCSLSLKLENYLITEGAKVFSHDPFVKSVPLNEALKNADILIIGTNHDDFTKLRLKDLKKIVSKNCIICDIWNIFNTGKIIFRLNDFASRVKASN